MCKWIVDEECEANDCYPAVEARASMTESRSALDVVEGIDLSGKTCVITGASSGLGRESARALAAAGGE